MNLGVPTAHVSYQIINNRRVNENKVFFDFSANTAFFFLINQSLDTKCLIAFL